MKKGVDFIGVAVVFFCHDGQGNFVMAKRSQNARDEQGNWDIGGGGVEFEDTVENNLRKEIAEEYGCAIQNFEFLGYRDVLRIIDGQKSHWIALDYKVLVNKNEVKINEPEKFDDIAWFRIDNLPEKLHSQLHIFFDNYKDRL